MIDFQNQTLLHKSGLKLIVTPAERDTRCWDMEIISIDTPLSRHPSGAFTLLAENKAGLPVAGLNFVARWNDGLTYLEEVYSGRYVLALHHRYDPVHEIGPYWIGLDDPGVAPEIEGIGLPFNHDCYITVVLKRTK